MTLIELAKKDRSNALIRQIAKSERILTKDIVKDISRGYTVIPKNKKHNLAKPCGIGRRLKTKVNVNIGTSPDSADVKTELNKLALSVRLGADTVMDLSIGRGLQRTRERILEKCPVPLGTVPIYEAAVMARNDFAAMRELDIMNALKKQADEGVDFFTVHVGVTKETVKALKGSKRVIDIVSRGGAILYKWMMTHKKENPFYARFDEILDLARDYDITLSLGDAMRPGAIADASDKAQIMELQVLGELQKRALKRGVQTIIEGPGHVPLNQIKENIEMEKSICHGAPFYVLGPLVTDIAPGYDHITSAIGGAIAASYGADYLCYVTPAEHLRLPRIEDVREGLIASKIAAHAADIAKGRKDALMEDINFSRAREKRDWETQFKLALETEKPVAYRKNSLPQTKDVCTMCSDYCPIKISKSENKP